MLALDVEEFMVEFKEGSISNVGATNKRATAKLYDAEDVEVRPYGDERVKLTAADAEGNEVQVALFPEDAGSVADALQALREEGDLVE